MGQAGGPGVGAEKKWGWEVMWGAAGLRRQRALKAEERMWGCSRAGRGMRGAGWGQQGRGEGRGGQSAGV